MSQMHPHRDPRANRLLGALEPGDLTALEPHLEVVSLPRRSVLYETGEAIDHAYFPHDALVSLVNVLEDGRCVEVAVFGREGGFGLLSTHLTPRSFGRYIVRLPGTASRIPLTQLREARNTRPSLRHLLMRYGEAFLEQALQTVSCNAAHSVEVRCCSWILHIQDRVDREELPLTHEFLSEILGVQRSTVSLILGTLQTKGLIKQGRGVICIADRTGMEQTACECYGRIRQTFERLLPNTYAQG